MGTGPFYPGLAPLKNENIANSYLLIPFDTIYTGRNASSWPAFCHRPTHYYTILGLISAVMAFRLVFKLLGANPENAFVCGIYAFTQPIVGVFEGI